MADLVEYYGTECHFCKQMAPLVERLEKEKKVKVEKIEVWHNEENARKLLAEDKIDCGGVPFFVNRKTGKQVCGAMDYDELVKWATGK